MKRTLRTSKTQRQAHVGRVPGVRLAIWLTSASAFAQPSQWDVGLTGMETYPGQIDGRLAVILAVAIIFLCLGLAAENAITAKSRKLAEAIRRRARLTKPRIPTLLRVVFPFALFSLPLAAQTQDPWSRIATLLAAAFTGPIARGFSLVAIVIGGLSLAFSDGGGRRALGGLIFGCGMALAATQFLTWLFG